MTPRFSVIVPAYNATGTIEATIRSVLAQTATELELIVVDDGSTDGTGDLVAAIASTDERVELIAQPNQGTAGARNTGIARASAAYVSFLDNDDLWMPRYLEAAGEALDAGPRSGVRVLRRVDPGAHGLAAATPDRARNAPRPRARSFVGAGLRDARRA